MRHWGNVPLQISVYLHSLETLYILWLKFHFISISEGLVIYILKVRNIQG